jgi:glyoxylase-like metal-dependent hydrolase (beta-lactamase superfamily II)
LNFIFEQIRAGGDRNFGYLIGDRKAKEGTLVDPSYSPEAFVERARAQGLSVGLIINTHGHSDHTNGNSRAKELTGARLAAYKDSAVKPDIKLDDGQSIAVGSLSIRVFYVPGHAVDHLLLYLPQEKIAITGDLLFVGKVGGTESDEDARKEHESLQKLLRELPDDTTIWPGHDFGCRPVSTVFLEKATNPFLQVKDLAAFLELKRNWTAFKAGHGLK